MDEDAHKGFLISDEYDSNDPDSDIEAESLTSTPEVEIVNYGESVTFISKEEDAQMFPEGVIFVQEINEVIEMFP